jgi:hypothetical protein
MEVKVRDQVFGAVFKLFRIQWVYEWALSLGLGGTNQFVYKWPRLGSYQYEILQIAIVSQLVHILLIT